MHDNKFFRKHKRKAEKLFVVVNGNFSLNTSFKAGWESFNVGFAAACMKAKRGIDSLLLT